MALPIEAVPVGRAAVRRAAAPRGAARPDAVLLADAVPLADALSTLRQPWNELLEGALDPHPYYGPTMLGAHRAAGLAEGVRCLTAVRGGRLVGVLPFRPASAIVGWRRADAAWASPYTTSSRPLVATDDAEGAVAALLDGMGASANPLWLLPAFTTDDALAAIFLRQVAGRGWCTALLDGFARPVLCRPPSGIAPGPTGWRRDLVRRRRRLAEQGTVALRTTAAPAGRPAALERFLALEASGWKGRCGTALGSRASTRALAQALLDGPPGELRIDELTLDGATIASSLALVAGGTAYLWKSAYDERFARFAPGILIEAAIVDEVLRTGSASRLDACTRPGTPLDAILPGRDTVGDLVVWTRPNGAAILPRLLRAERVRRDLAGRAKSAFRRSLGRS